MIQKQTIEALAQEHLQGTELSLVEVSVSEDNDSEVIITRAGGGVSIGRCGRAIDLRMEGGMYSPP